MSQSQFGNRDKVNDILEDIRGYAATAAGGSAMGSSRSPLDGVPRDAVNDILEDIRASMRALAGASGGGGSIAFMGPSAPLNPTNGKLWFNTTILTLFVYHDDGNSTQWVQAVP